MRIRAQFWLLAAAVPLLAAPPAIELKVAAVQFRSTFQVGQNVGAMTEILDRLASDGVKVAVFPECALTGYHKLAVMEPTEGEVSAAEKRIQQACERRRIATVFGSIYKVNGHAHDTAVVFDSHGQLVERYGKVMLSGEKWATPGNHIAYFELEGVPSTVIICHDERYPELVRLPALQGARIVYYVSSESGMSEELKLAPYRAQVMARAVENDMFLVQANAPANPDLSGSHGQSRIVAADGNVLQEASFFGADILVATVAIKPGNPQRALDGLRGRWWRQGVDFMMSNRHRQLD